MQGLVTLTSTVIGGQPPGTAIYMVPELLVKNEQATIESDMWSVAISFLEFDTETEAWESSDDQNESGDCIKNTGYLKRKQSPPSLGQANGKVLHVMRNCLSYQQT